MSKVFIPSKELIGELPLDIAIDTLTIEKDVNGIEGIIKLAYPFFRNSLFQKVKIIKDDGSLETIGLSIVKWDEEDRQNNPGANIFAKLIGNE